MRIALVHALRESMDPAEAAFREIMPEAELAHLFDGSLYLDRSKDTSGSSAYDDRIAALLVHAERSKADAGLFTGSFFNDPVRKGRETLGIPFLASFDGLIGEALDAGNNFLIISTAPDSVGLLAEDLGAVAQSRDRTVYCVRRAVPQAVEALLSGDRKHHDHLVVEAAAGVEEKVDAILLAQFSMAPAAQAVADRMGLPVLTAPHAAARMLKRQLG